ncbi:MAG: hypothetical protein OXG81_08735, partial [Acidobacteria bacterium]|nr:hypothetical protein [Acidobacteriota bacterium]
PSFSDINITVPGIQALLSGCNPHKSPGPDNIHAAFLKHTSAQIAPMLTHLFQQSLRDSIIPSIWKKAYVTLFIKKETGKTL